MFTRTTATIVVEYDIIDNWMDHDVLGNVKKMVDDRLKTLVSVELMFGFSDQVKVHRIVSKKISKIELLEKMP